MTDEVFADNYRLNGSMDYPIVDVEVLINSGLGHFKAVLDTGCDVGINLTSNDIKKLKLSLGKPMNNKPLPAVLADNSVKAAYYYPITLTFGGMKMPSTLSVINLDEEYELTEEEKKKIEEEEVTALLGREVMDCFVMNFNGTIKPKRFAFCK